MNTDIRLTTTQVAQRLQTRRFHGLHADVTDTVLKVFYKVYNELGGGFLESVYHKAFAMALRQAGFAIAVEEPVPAYFRGLVIEDFRADLTVNGCVLLELKAVSALDRAHEGQVPNYLRATDFEVGLLFNFGPKPQFKRFLLDNQQKKSRTYPCKSVVGPSEGSNR